MRSFRLMGFTRKPTMPQAFDSSWTLDTISAVRAMIGGFLAPRCSPAMMRLLASSPSITGMWMSIRIRSNTSSFTASRPSCPLLAILILYGPMDFSTFWITRWLRRLSSHTRMFMWAALGSDLLFFELVGPESVPFPSPCFSGGVTCRNVVIRVVILSSVMGFEIFMMGFS